MEESLKAWEQGIKRLHSQLKNYGTDTQVKYEDQLDQLTKRWHTAKEQLEVYGGSTQDKLSGIEAGFNRTIGEIQQKFVALVQQLNREESLPLGWAEGMAEHLPIGSEGWSEGQATQPKTSEESEGWAEGLAREEPMAESVGWAEGYRH
jgi:hypothetical protein